MNAPYAWLAYWKAYHAAYAAEEHYTRVLKKHRAARYTFEHKHPEAQRAKELLHAATERMHNALHVARAAGPRWPHQADSEIHWPR